MNQSPPIPLIIKSLVVFNGSHWVPIPLNSVIIDTKYTNSIFYGYPAIKVQLSISPLNSQASYVAAITQYGNIIYASSPYILPNYALKKAIGIIAIDPYNFTIIQQPSFKIISSPYNSIPLLQFVNNVNNGYSNTVTFYWAYLGSNKSNAPFYYNGSWFGPIVITNPNLNVLPISPGSLSTPQFMGKISGIFTNANLTINGYFNGYIGSNSQNPIYINGESNYAIFNNSFIIGNLNGDFIGKIIIPKANNAKLLDILSNTYAEIYIANVSANIKFNGNFSGIVNGNKVNLTNAQGMQISGYISQGTLKGNIISASFSASNNFIGIINGKLYGVSINAKSVTNIFGQIINSPIISGKLINTNLNNLIVTSVVNSVFGIITSSQIFNISLSNFYGNITLSNNYGSGTFNGIIIFNKPSSFNPQTTAIEMFNGYINGVFKGGYYLSLGTFLTSVTLSVVNSNASVFPAYHIINSYYWIIQPLIIKVSVNIANPSNQTLEFSSIQVFMKSYGTFQIFGGSSSGNNIYSFTIFGSASNLLNPPIVISPYDVRNYTLYLTIPVTNIFSPQLSPSDINNPNSLTQFSIDYIELNLLFIESNGFAVSVYTIISPYSMQIITKNT
ncbi:MAG: hypothetical protein QXV69_09440 [Sulfolobaceae archaeon]